LPINIFSFPFVGTSPLFLQAEYPNNCLQFNFWFQIFGTPDPASIPFAITGNSWFSFNFSILAGATSSDKPIMQGGYFLHSPSTYLHYDMMAVMVALHQIIKLTPTQPKSET